MTKRKPIGVIRDLFDAGMLTSEEKKHYKKLGLIIDRKKIKKPIKENFWKITDSIVEDRRRKRK